jgi:uncharacterized protein (TIGR03545 family)
MKWGYLIPRVILVAMVWTFFVFAFDPILRYSAINMGESAVGAKVGIASLETTFFPPSLKLGAVDIANPQEPMTNLATFETLQVKVAGKPLLRQSLIVEQARITGLEWGTARTKSGRLEETETPGDDPDANQEPGVVDRFGVQAAEVGQEWLDDLINRVEGEFDPQQFESVRLAESLEADWKKRFDDLQSRAKNSEEQSKKLADALKDAKGSTLERLRVYQDAVRQGNGLLADVDTIRGDLQGLSGTAREDFARIQAARERDLASLRDKLDYRNYDAEKISRSLLGPKLGEQLQSASDWIDLLQKYAKALQAAPKPERMRGIEIVFKRPSPQPQFLLKSLQVSGRAQLGEDRMPFKGLITGITSDPALHGKPVVVRAAGEGDGRLDLYSVLDYRNEVPVHDLQMAYSLPKSDRIELGEPKKLSLLVDVGRTDWKVDLKLTGDVLTGRLSLQQSPVSITANAGPELKEDIGRVISGALSGVRHIEAEVILTGTYDHPEWVLHSNLGDQIRDGMQAFVARELEVRQQELAQKADAIIRERVGKFETNLTSRYRETLAQLNLNESQTRELIQRVANRGLGSKLPGNLGKRFDLKKLGILPR